VLIRSDGECAEKVAASAGQPEICLSFYDTGTTGWTLAAGGAAVGALGSVLLWNRVFAGAPVAVVASPFSLALRGRF
jgi:hypothetical protein